MIRYRAVCDDCGPIGTYPDAVTANIAATTHRCPPTPGPRTCSDCGGRYPVDYLASECAQRHQARTEVPA